MILDRLNLKRLFKKTTPTIDGSETVSLAEYFDDTVRRVTAINRHLDPHDSGTRYTRERDVAEMLLRRGDEKLRITREFPVEGQFPLRRSEALIDRCDELRDEYALPLAPVAYLKGDGRKVVAVCKTYEKS